MDLWDRYARAVTARRAWIFALALVVIVMGVLGMAGSGGSEAGPDSLPGDSESAQVKQALREFPDAGAAPAILVVTRSDDQALDAGDRAAATAALERMQATEPAAAQQQSAPPVTAPDGKAVIGQVPVDSSLSGFDLKDRISELRSAARDGLPPALTARVTGGPAFGADIADAFSGASITLLGVTAAVVAVLLIATYRSPVLWLVPLLVIGVADRVASVAGSSLAALTGLSFDGSTSGITSVLVFGAGTNYALLMISRYRDELRREPDHRTALRRAVRRAAPAIAASNATVVLALLVLLLAALPSTRSLGAFGAVGLVIALVSVLLVLPPALAVFGRGLFWPFVPRADAEAAAPEGIWHRVAVRVTAHRLVAAIGSVALLAVLACGLTGVHSGLTQTEQFRVTSESELGYDTLAQHFPSGASTPATVVADRDAAERVQSTLSATPGVDSVIPTGTTDDLARWAVTLDAAPSSSQAFDTVTAMRQELSGLDAHALVGGSDAQELDVRDAADRDQKVVIPLILVVVTLVLLVLLRAPAAALIPVLATALSAVAAIGAGGWLTIHVLGFPALDTTVPLFAFLFLVALGVDYTIFLLARTREETPQHGTIDGIVRAVSATGAVITSAGIVLAAVFAVLGVLPLITLTQLGVIVGIGILLDTFIVRTIVIPAIFALAGPRIWWPTRLQETQAPADKASAAVG